MVVGRWHLAQSTINSGGKYRTVSRTFMDKVPLVAHGHARIRFMYVHTYTRACAGVYTYLRRYQRTRCTCVERKEGTTEERLERRTERRGKEEEERKTGGK